MVQIQNFNQNREPELLQIKKQIWHWIDLLQQMWKGILNPGPLAALENPEPKCICEPTRMDALAPTTGIIWK
jgi:hypothetical protein